MMFWNWGSGMNWWMLIWGAWFLLFWVGIILLAFWGITKLMSAGRGQASTTQNPLNIARERYARGEITREEFEQLKKDLS